MKTPLPGLATVFRSSCPCFVAGTPVWTDKGLVPIEKIQVGDMLLSKSETTGEKAFKRVLRTLRTEDEELCTFCAEGTMNEDGSELLVEFLFATPGHLIWVNGQGWMTLGELYDPGQRYVIDNWTFERANGRKAMFFAEYEALGAPVLSLSDAENPTFVCIGSNSAIGDGKIGYTMRFDGTTQLDGFDPFVYADRSTRNTRVAFHGATFTGEDLDDLNRLKGPVTNFRTTVFNIEVEEFRTYFVGELGLWVHNACSSLACDLVSNPSITTGVAR